jgi:CTP:molybdopterin cytidylyltransferase MocA
LLAAGKGSRMGRTKQLIEIPCADGKSKPLVALAFDAIARTCAEMIVVVDTDRDRVVECLGERPFVVATAPGSAQMSASVIAGLRVANARWPQDPVLLQLGDHAAVQQNTLTQLCTESRKFPARTIIPTYHRAGGHPILIPPTVIARLLSEPALGALRDYWRQHPELCLRCEVEDEAVIRDLDNPAQLAEEVKRRSNL